MNPLKTIASVFSERWREPSVCQSCSNEFTCGAKLSGCWCAEIKLSEETRATLRCNFQGCLCRACLESAAEGKITGDAGSKKQQEGI